MNDVTKDLLKALKIVTSQLERVGDTRKHKDGEFIDLGREAIARAEAALAEPQPDADGWIPWAGGDCPLERRVRHQVRFRYGDESHWSKCPYGWNWEHTGAPTDIIAYRIVEAKP